MAFKTTTVTGTFHNCDTEATAGSIAKAVYDVAAAATSVTYISIAPLSMPSSSDPQMVAVIVWKNA